MAQTFAARRLTEAHRLAQLRLGAQTVARMGAVWSLLHPDNLDGTFDRWLLAAVPLIQAQRSTSARLAANYLSIFKSFETGGPRELLPALQESADTKALTTSLLVTGPLSIKRAMLRSVPLGRAVDIAQSASSASGMRYALNGGRETLIESVKSDREARGWVRVTSGNACEYCAEREGVLMSDADVFEAHDGCGCAPEPAY